MGLALQSRYLGAIHFKTRLSFLKINKVQVSINLTNIFSSLQHYQLSLFLMELQKWGAKACTWLSAYLFDVADTGDLQGCACGLQGRVEADRC